MRLTLDTALPSGDVCDDVVLELFRDLGLSAPPVDAVAVAERLGFTVVCNADQPGRGRIKRLCGQPTIFIRPEDRPERVQWSVAHEIGEALASRIFERLGFLPDDLAGTLEPARREQLANEFASRLLLPSAWFLADARELDGDLPALKSVYSTASHELILMNLLRLRELSLATVFDHGRLTRRRGNGQLAAPPLLPMERTVWRQVHASGEPVDMQDGSVRVQAWAVHEPGWKRELLRTTPIDCPDEAMLE